MLGSEARQVPDRIRNHLSSRVCAFFVNGHAVSGAIGFAEFKHLIDGELKAGVRPTQRPSNWRTGTDL